MGGQRKTPDAMKNHQGTLLLNARGILARTSIGTEAGLGTGDEVLEIVEQQAEVLVLLPLA